MKIIKQNDSAGGLIFKQNTDGKAMKQNYNFGNGFFKSNLNNVYIELPTAISLDIYQPFSIIAFLDTLPSGAVRSDSIFRLEGVTDNLTKAFASVYQSNGAMYISSAIGQFNFPNNTNAGSTNNLIGVIGDGTYIRPTGNSADNSVIAQRILLSGLTPDSSYRVLAGRGGGAAFANGYVYRKMDDFMVYKRALTQQDLAYIYNNKLGNEPLSTNMLSVRYTFDQFEIKSFNGVDAVCAVDVSGNENHGKLIGLPAGTLQEQLDWANLNCLK